MGKHKVLPTVSAPAATVSALDQLEQGLALAFAAATAALEDPSADAAPQLLREMSSIARARVSVVAERRAAEKARVYSVRNLPPELVMEWLRGLHPERRGAIVRELIAMDEEGASVLA